MQLDSPKRALDGVQIMRSDSHKLPPSAQILVEFILQIDETRVFQFVHGSSESEDG